MNCIIFYNSKLYDHVTYGYGARIFNIHINTYNELTSTEGVSADDLTVFTTSLSVISPHSYIITLSTAEVSEPM